ncbi:MAG: leader peptide processing enzyme [Treponema sp.]|nr:leader peptide processing enzyme [Treponema sp.]MCL2250852.1 leader peptide processing enzyme [Treponema sp.]
MNKKVNTLLFVLGATLFNILIAVISFVLFTIIFINFIAPHIPPSGRSWGFNLILLASLAVSFFVYRIVLKLLISKVNVEKYFDPIFVKKGLKKNNTTNP